MCSKESVKYCIARWCEHAIASPTNLLKMLCMVTQYSVTSQDLMVHYWFPTMVPI